MKDLYWNTASSLLRSILEDLMDCKLFDPFRLIGGTALALQLGHRISVDIDLFTDANYDSVNFVELDAFMRQQYPYVSNPTGGPVAMGRQYFVGKSEDEAIKLDIYYTDPFIRPPLIIGSVRMATVEDIIAMKIDVVQRGGRKKDFWDIHELMNDYSIENMINLHEERYPFSHDRGIIVQNFTEFTEADEDFEPLCLKGKYWELIKLDIIEAMKTNSL